jgi:hypothetical protein
VPVDLEGAASGGAQEPGAFDGGTQWAVCGGGDGEALLAGPGEFLRADQKLDDAHIHGSEAGRGDLDRFMHGDGVQELPANGLGVAKAEIPAKFEAMSPSRHQISPRKKE